ncbi:MAG TPA: diguanylate cyclase [Gallionella sp.]|nr:diguanylate cyclase [Gallionella sp.]
MSTAINISRELLAQAIDQSHDGVTIADATKENFPLIFVNRGFEKLTGYTSDEIIGYGYRILQGIDTEQPGLDVIRIAVAKGEGCIVTLRNYRKDGSMFWNELSISPVHDSDGNLTHYIGIQKDVTTRILFEQHLHQSGIDLQTLIRQLNTLIYTNHPGGVSNRRHFDELFATLLSTAQRTHSELSVLMIDFDHFKQFNQRYGRSAGDEYLRMVGDCITKSFARTSDCTARYGEEGFAVISLATNIDDLRNHVQKLCEQVRALNIPNSDSSYGVVTISIGGINRLPGRESTGTELIKQANQALLTAKRSGGNRTYIAV